MTTTPHTIGQEQTLGAAHKMLREHHIRHLPVLHAGKLVGILSDRDLSFIETLRDVDPEKVTVEEAMTQTPYTTSPETPLDEVVTTMAQHKYGSVVIVDNDHVVGVFTAIDAMTAFADLLHSRLTH
jgi:acetoin utilization protein AcuB